MFLKKIPFQYIILIIFSILLTKSFAIENKIVVKVNNKIITYLDIINEKRYLKALNPNLNNLEENKVYEIAKNSLVREKIKEIEILKYKKIEINQDYLENIIGQVYKKIGFNNKTDFIKYLTNLNINISLVEKKLSNEAIWNSLIYERFNSQLKINNEEIEKNVKNLKNTSKSYLLSEILFSIENKNQKEKYIQKITQSINENGFGNTALIFSISDSANTGGKLGWVNENNISKKILNELNKIKRNQYTNPILIPGGYLILYIEDIKTIEKKIDFEKEILARKRNLQTQQLNQFSNIFFNKIRKNAIINEK
ncbi:peptidylprolyl isomerase [Candidatus Pelagibacter sp. HIMB1506]|uniref:peptidylprolyl isomerase n=1 Tax=Candidatus Pelagibacter sp. HIMB1506 TaxID=3413337 RepID=UPI003F856EC9